MQQSGTTMRYIENIKEKKYKPLFGYGYEPRVVNQNKKRKAKQEPLYDALGQVIYDLPVEAEADLDDPADQVEKARVQTQDSQENHFPKPDESPWMSIVIAVTIAIALFLTAVIMSYTKAPDSVRIDTPQNQIVMDLCVSDLE